MPRSPRFLIYVLFKWTLKYIQRSITSSPLNLCDVITKVQSMYFWYLIKEKFSKNAWLSLKYEHPNGQGQFQIYTKNYSNLEFLSSFSSL